jgi:hypothetical protein
MVYNSAFFKGRNDRTIEGSSKLNLGKSEESFFLEPILFIRSPAFCHEISDKSSTIKRI